MAVQFDYDSINNRILANLSAKSEHKNVMQDSALQILVSAIAQEDAYEMEYSEYLTYENNWALARNKSSLLTESKVHNYNVPRKVGATGELSVSAVVGFDSAPSVNIDVPKWTQFSTDNDISFTAVENNAVTTGDNSITINVVQGISKSSSFVATGAVNETFTVQNDDVENVYFEVYVNGLEWTSVNTLYDSESTDKVFKIESLRDLSGVKLFFGNDINGKQLTASDDVVFRYVETLGETGNVIYDDYVTNVDSTIYTISGDRVDLFCTNDDALAGGASEATLEEIRDQSPKFFQSGDRCSSPPDYEVLVGEFSYVKKVAVYGAMEYNQDNGNDLWDYIATKDNLVSCAVLTTSDDDLSTSQKNEIIRGINDRKPPTDIVEFPTILKIGLIFNIVAKVTSTSYTLNEVSNSITTTLASTYDIDVLDFYESIYESDYKRVIDEVAGVRYHTTDISLEYVKDFDSAYVASYDLPLYPITGTTLEIYVKLKTELLLTDYVLIGTGDATGIISGEAGYTFSGASQINITTGSGSFSVLSGLASTYTLYDVRVLWKPVALNIELTARNQLLSYTATNITSIDYFRR